jgi:hypothetical protein
MEAQSNHWLPLTEYALRSGTSISTLRRKIKSNSIEYKMEEGRYLIRSDDLLEEKTNSGFSSSDNTNSRSIPDSRPSAPGPAVNIASSPLGAVNGSADLAAIREELRKIQEDNLLRWKMLEARVVGIAKKLDLFAEQMAETKMLVKIFEEKLDQRA